MDFTGQDVVPKIKNLLLLLEIIDQWNMIITTMKTSYNIVISSSRIKDKWVISLSNIHHITWVKTHICAISINDVIYNIDNIIYVDRITFIIDWTHIDDVYYNEIIETGGMFGPMIKM